MAQKEQEQPLNLNKLLIPTCVAIPFSITILKNHESGNCTAVTEKGECPHAERRHHVRGKFKCRKDTLMKINTPLLV